MRMAALSLTWARTKRPLTDIIGAGRAATSKLWAMRPCKSAPPSTARADAALVFDPASAWA